MKLKNFLLLFRLKFLRLNFEGSKNFWTQVYASGGNSGEGSYGELANFKAEILNSFVSTHEISSVMEFGCGDGNQLSLMNYPVYIGLDVAPGAIKRCIEKFNLDTTKSFLLIEPKYFQPGASFSADLTLSLDVIFHLSEIETYETHLRQLFASSNKWVIIYGYNSDAFFPEPYSVPRKFTNWIEKNLSEWTLESTVKNRFPIGSGPEASWSDFYIFRRISDNLI